MTDEMILDDAGMLATVLMLRKMPSLQLRIKRKGKWELISVSELSNEELLQYINDLGETLDDVTSEISELILQQSNISCS